jgi:TM2 domain-containing membrane protein YozV
MPPAQKRCPSCRQPVFIRANTCPYCRYAFPPPDRAPTKAAPPPAYPAPPPRQPVPPPAPPPVVYAPQTYAYVVPPSRRSRSSAILWTFFLGGVGAHKFYLGRPGWGIAYLLFCWTWIPAIAAFFEMLWFLFMSDAEFDRRYNTYHILV